MLIDLFFLLLLSLFLGIRLWNVLGKNVRKNPPQKQKNLFILSKEQVVVEKEPDTGQAFYPGFSESQFLEGAERAFEQVVLAYHKGDKKILERLVAPHLLPAFSQKPVSPKGEFKKVCLLSSTISSRALNKKSASIAVQFTSQQTYGEHIETIDETWVFTRHLLSKNPNWLLDQVGDENLAEPSSRGKN